MFDFPTLESLLTDAYPAPSSLFFYIICSLYLMEFFCLGTSEMSSNKRKLADIYNVDIPYPAVLPNASLTVNKHHALFLYLFIASQKQRKLSKPITLLVDPIQFLPLITQILQLARYFTIFLN